MERIYAFTDEYGSFGWKLEDKNEIVNNAWHINRKDFEVKQR